MNKKSIGSMILAVLVALSIIGKAVTRAVRNANRDNQQTSEGIGNFSLGGGMGTPNNAETQLLKRMENVKKTVLSSPEREKPYLERRAGFKSQLTRKAKAPQDWNLGPLPAHLQIITYPSGNLNLQAILYVTPNSGNTRRPALVYYHGGFALDHEDLEDCEPFVEDGFVVMMPMLRSENNGEGYYELFGGELDDAANAIRWLSRHPNVDANNIYAFGHSIGGGIAAMMSLMNDDLPLKHCGSSGGLYGPETFFVWRYGDEDGPDMVPFDPENVNESLMRTLYGNVKWMKRKHYAYIGRQDEHFLPNIVDMRNENMLAPDKNLLNIVELGGDHFTSLMPAVRQYHTAVKSGLRTENIVSAPNTENTAVPSNTETTATPSDIMARILLGSQTSETTPAPSTQPITPTQPVLPVQSARSDQFRENNTRINAPNNHRDFNMDRDELGGVIGDKFSETIPRQAHLVGFEISKGSARSSRESLVSVQALYRSRDGEKQSKGKLYGQKSGDVGRAYAPPGYAVGGLRGQAFGEVTGFELVFMKIRPDGTLDPNNAQTSDWIGGRNENLPHYSVLSGHGRHVSAVSGSIFMGKVHSIKLEYE